MKHQCTLQGNGNTATPITETIFNSHLTGTISWSRVGPGHYRGAYPAFTHGNVFILHSLRPAAASTELHMDVVLTDNAEINGIDVFVFDAEFNGCDEFLANIELTISI